MTAIWSFCFFVFNEKYEKNLEEVFERKTHGALPTPRAREKKFRGENRTVHQNFNLIYILISNFRMRTLTNEDLEVESEVDAAQEVRWGRTCVVWL